MVVSSLSFRSLSIGLTKTCHLDFLAAARYEELENASLEAWLSSSLAATQEILSSGLVDDGDGSSLDRPLPVQMEEILDLVTG